MKKRRILKEEYGGLASELFTVKCHMEDFGYDEDAKRLERRLSGLDNDSDFTEYDHEIIDILDDVYRDAKEKLKRAKRRGINIDDFDDFISEIGSARNSYLYFFADWDDDYGDLSYENYPVPDDWGNEDDVNESRKNVVRINENTVKKIVAESLKKILRESDYPTLEQNIKKRG